MKSISLMPSTFIAASLFLPTHLSGRVWKSDENQALQCFQRMLFSLSVFFSYSKDTTANSLTHHQLAGQVLTLIWFFESNCEYSKTLVMSADPAALFTHVEWFKKLISYLYFCFPEESFPVQCTLIIPGVRSLNRNKSEDWFPAHQVNFCTTLW